MSIIEVITLIVFSFIVLYLIADILNLIHPQEEYVFPYKLTRKQLLKRTIEHHENTRKFLLECFNNKPDCWGDITWEEWLKEMDFEEYL